MENKTDTPDTPCDALREEACPTQSERSENKNPRKGKIVGPKRPFKSGDIWELRRYLKMKGRTRDLALFNLGIDSKLRACDLLDLKVSDIGSDQSVFQQATVVQKKTDVAVTFEITETARTTVLCWVRTASLSPDDYLWPSRNRRSKRLSMSQYSRIIKQFAQVLEIDTTAYATHSIRRTKVTLIYRKSQNLRACQLLLGHKKIENTVRYLGLDLDEALKISRDIDI